MGKLRRGAGAGSRARRENRRRLRPGLLELEARRLLSTVTDTSDNPNDTGSLRYAVDQATSGTTIQFAPNVTGTITLTNGTLDINKSLNIIGPGAGTLAISGNNNRRVFKVEANVTASISGLTITQGNVHGYISNTEYGGALYNLGTVNLNNVNISNNYAVEGAGGIFNYGSARLTMTNCTVSGNSVSDSRGSDAGGGLLNAGRATLTMLNCTISDNASFNGGGVYNVSYSGATTTLTNCTVTGNTAKQSGGGVMNVFSPAGSIELGNGPAAIRNAGGAMSFGSFGSATANPGMVLTNCTISGNKAYAGGGVYDAGSATTDLTACTVSNNVVGRSGGGLVVNAPLTGGPYGNATLSDTIVAGNNTTSAVASDISSEMNVLGTYNLIGNGGSGGLVNGVGGNIVGVADPGLGALGSYGGPTQTMALLPGSKALGTGNPAAVTGTDQRGFRLDMPRRDIGAFQTPNGWATTPLPLVVTTTSDSSNTPAGRLSLRQAVNLANLLNQAATITFDPTAFATSQTIALTSAQQLELSETGGLLTITTQGLPAGVTVSVSGSGMSRVFQVDPGVTASLSGLTITGGGGTADRGGGVLDLGNVSLTNCMITGNTASSRGGGLADYGTANLTNCTVSGNKASGNGGGVFSYNSSGGGSASLTDCTVTGNAAGAFGGSGSGGGLFCKGPAINLTDCTVSNNTASQSAGGLWSYSTTSPGLTTLANCTVSGNTAGTSGGGVENFTGKAYLTNCTLSANVASGGGGGGVFNFDGNATTALTDCTLSGNSAASGGGGLLNSGTAILTGTIVAGNKSTANASVASDIAGASVSGTFNLIGTGGSGGLMNGVGGNIVGVSDPHLGALGSYGGPTQTMALLPGSMAIGNGTMANYPGTKIPITTDQRGLARGSKVDIGAFQTSLVVESTAGSINTAPAQLTLAGAVSLAKEFAGPIAISFDPSVFSSPQTIALSAGQLELTSTVPIWTITGPEKGVTISGGTSRVFQVDKNVTASFSGLTIASGFKGNAAGLDDLGTAELSNCIFRGVLPSSGVAILVSGGQMVVIDTTITGWLTGIVVDNQGTAAIADSTITGNGSAIVVGASGAGSGFGLGAGASSDRSTVIVHDSDLSGDTVGIDNVGSRPVDATFNWWGSSGGPNSPGASRVIGSGVVNSSPWLGDAQSLNLPIPDSLGFASVAGNSYVVTPSLAAPVSLGILLNGNPVGTVTPKGTILFTGTGGNVTINGEPGTDAFTITNAAVTFAANDAFSGAMIQLSGKITRDVDAKGILNSFDVSGWTGAGTLSAPVNAGTVSTVSASKKASFTLTNTALKATDGMALKLVGITTANLADTGPAGGQTFAVSGWTGAGSLTASAGAGTVTSSKDASDTLTDKSLSATDGMELNLSGIKTATLVDTGGGHAFTVSGWTGSGLLLNAGGAGDAVVASKNFGFALSNNSLSSTDGMALSLSQIATANLTAFATGGSPSVIVDASRVHGSHEPDGRGHGKRDPLRRRQRGQRRDLDGYGIGQRCLDRRPGCEHSDRQRRRQEYSDRRRRAQHDDRQRQRHPDQRHHHL